MAMGMAAWGLAIARKRAKAAAGGREKEHAAGMGWRARLRPRGYGARIGTRGTRIAAKKRAGRLTQKRRRRAAAAEEAAKRAKERIQRRVWWARTRAWAAGESAITWIAPKRGDGRGAGAPPELAYAHCTSTENAGSPQGTWPGCKAPPPIPRNSAAYSGSEPVALSVVSGVPQTAGTARPCNAEMATLNDATLPGSVASAEPPGCSNRSTHANGDALLPTCDVCEAEDVPASAGGRSKEGAAPLAHAARGAARAVGGGSACQCVTCAGRDPQPRKEPRRWRAGADNQGQGRETQPTCDAACGEDTPIKRADDVGEADGGEEAEEELTLKVGCWNARNIGTRSEEPGERKQAATRQKIAWMLSWLEEAAPDVLVILEVSGSIPSNKPLRRALKKAGYSSHMKAGPGQAEGATSTMASSWRGGT